MSTRRIGLGPTLRWQLAVLGAVLYGIVSCGPPEPPDQAEPGQPSRSPEMYMPPPEGTSSLVHSLEARRNRKGQVTVAGQLLLPAGTALWVEVFDPNVPPGRSLVGESKPHLASGGSFEAGPFNLPRPGRYRVQLTAHFNGAWQSRDVLAVVGSNGTNLPKSALTPDDPEFPQAGGHLEYSGSVNVGELSPELQAIEAVKHAKLFVKGRGQAVDTVGEIVKYFETPGMEFYPGDWSAQIGPDSKWKVSLQHRWGNEQKIANWEYDPHSKQVKYLDPESKMLSWIPAE